MHANGVQFHYHRPTLVLFGVLAGGMIALGAALIVTASPWGDDVPKGLFIVLFCLSVLVFVARTWRDRAPVVEIGPTGIHDHRLGDSPIPWEAITAIRGIGVWDNRIFRWLGRLAGLGSASNRFAGIVVTNWQDFHHPPNPLVGVLARLTARLTGYPVLSINMGPLDGSYEDLARALRNAAEGKPIDLDL